MASSNEYDNVPMLPVSVTSSSARTRPLTSTSRSLSLANTSSTIDGLDSSTVVLNYTDPPLVQMGDPLSTTRSSEPPFSLPPSTGGSYDSVGASSSQPERNHAYNRKAAQVPIPIVSAISDPTLHNALDDDAKGWARLSATSVDKYLPKLRNLHPKFTQNCTKLFAFSCLFSVFVDPLFFFLIEVNKNKKCIQINLAMVITFVVVRSIMDFLSFLTIFFKLRHCQLGILVDLFIVIPLPQMFIFWIIPDKLGTSDAKNIFLIIVLVQYIPKLWRFLPYLAGQIESAVVKFIINSLTFMLAGHVVGSCWYLFGLERVKHCFEVACANGTECRNLIYCREREAKILHAWNDNAKANACYTEEGFIYGIYLKAVNLTYDSTPWYTRYSYSLFWGFQQLSTLAGNQVPSYFFGDILFTMIIIALGLLLLAFLIGNMQNFLLSLGRREMEMSLRKRDVRQWMSHKRFPKDIRKRVQTAERLNWNDTKGVNEELLFQNMPDDLQIDIRRHLFASIKKVKLFSEMDESILDEILERLKQRIYLKNSLVLRRGGLVKKILFIVRGKMESTEEDNSVTPLSDGHVCGEELLTWFQKRSSVNPDGTRIRMPSNKLHSTRDVKCVTEVQAYSLSVADLEEVVALIPDYRDSCGVIECQEP